MAPIPSKCLDAFVWNFRSWRSCNQCSESVRCLLGSCRKKRSVWFLHSGRLTCSPKKGLSISIGHTSSNHWFSGDMLVLDGVWWNFRLLQGIFMSPPLLKGVTTPRANCWGNIELKIFLWKLSAICRCSFKEKTTPENLSKSSGLLHQNRWLLGMMKKQLTLQKKTWPGLNPLRQNSNYNIYMSQGLNSLHWKWSSSP